MKYLVLFGVSAVASAAAVLLLANRTRVSLQTQGAALQAALTGEGTAREIVLRARGNEALVQAEIAHLVEPIVRSTVASPQAVVARNMASYGVTPSFLARLQQAARRLG